MGHKPPLAYPAWTLAHRPLLNRSLRLDILKKRFYEKLFEPDSFNTEKNIDEKADGKGMRKIRWSFYYFPGIKYDSLVKSLKFL